MTKPQIPDNDTQRLQFNFDWRASLLVVILLPVVVSLGFWQIERADEKRRLQSLFDDRQKLGAVAIETLADDADLRFQPVSLTGQFLNDKTAFLDNRVYQRRFGYEIITPFQLAGSEQIVLVNRGWLEGDSSRRSLPHVETIKGEVALSADIYVPQGEMMVLAEDANSGWPGVIQSIDIDEIQGLLGRPIFPYSVRLRAGNPGSYKAYWKIVNMQPEKHTGYAVQWFAMAIMLLFIALLANTNCWAWIKQKKRVI